MRFVLLTCALCAAACGGNDNRPANDPSTQTTFTSTPATTTMPVSADPTTGAQTASSTTTTNTTNGPSNTWSPNGTPGTAPVMGAPSDSTAAAPPAVVANNPGMADQTNGADNTRVNNRDRHGSTLTPMNQGNSKDELKITADIRRGLMGDKSLSFTAKNVKVITVGTKVTLRGPVKSDAEKAAIEARASQTPGVTDVDDQIEVKK